MHVLGARFRKQNQHCLDHQSFHEISFALETCLGLSVLEYSDSCFQEMRRPDPISQKREYHPTLILRPKK